MSDHAESRYQRDPQFHQLVDMLHNFIRKAEFSPTELREAVMLAHIHYSMLEARPFIYAHAPGHESEFIRFLQDGALRK